MSLRLRIKYQCRNFRDAFSYWRIPPALTGTASRVVLSALLIISGGLYIMQVNSLTTSGYQVKQLEQELLSIKSETKQLETELAVAESLSYINKRLPELGMVRATTISRLKAPGSVVAGR